MTKPTTKPNQQILDEAAEWFVTLREGEADVAVNAEFDAWLSRSPEHVRAYLDVVAIWTDVPGVSADSTGDASALIAKARAEDNVRELVRPSNPSAIREEKDNLSRTVPKPAPPVHASPANNAKRRPFLLAASVLIASLAGGITWWQLNRAPTYETEVGEQRSITLADGSRVDLNSQSRIRIRFSDTERAVDLQYGQGLFSVAKDPNRPFVVRSDTTSVRAVGTQFDVYRKPTGTTVTVLEGKVEVDDVRRTDRAERADEGRHERGDDRATGRGPIALVAGEQVTVHAGEVVQPKAVNVTTATAWTQRQLIFESASLADVAQEFNRYNTQPLVIDDAQLEDFHISGVFSSADPASLLRFLREQPEISVEEKDSEIRISKR